MIWVIGPYELDVAAYELRHDGAVQAIEPQVFELLVLLVENPHRLVTKDEMTERVWKGRIVSEATISSRIKAARQALGDDGRTQRLIKTIHGRGFRFVGDVVKDGTDDTSRSGSVNETGAAATDPDLNASNNVEIELPDRPSLVVLPFRLVSPDGLHQYLVDGLVDEITSGLSRVRSFFVIARGSANAIAEQLQDVKEITRILGVRYVLQGRLRLADNAIRVTVQLIDGPSREEVWTGSFNGELGHVFEVQDQITEAIIGALEPNILLAETRRARRQPPNNILAYDQALRAMPLCWSLNREANREAMRHLEAGIALDPAYGLAQALLSWCHGQQCVYNWTTEPEHHKRLALQHARRAVALDRDDPLVLILLGTAECVAGDVKTAAVHISKGLELDANSSWGWNRSGYVNCYLGKPGTAKEHFKRSLRLSPYDPLRHNLYVGMGLANFVGEDYECALQWIDKALLENPDIIWVHRLIAACAAMADDADRATESVKIVEDYAPDICVDDIVRAVPHQDPAVRERYRDALTRAGFRTANGTA